MMREIDVSASVAGNHEFNWGIECISKWERNGNFPFLAANILNKKTGKPVEWAKPYLMVEKNGVKVAFIGLATIEDSLQSHSKICERYRNL